MTLEERIAALEESLKSVTGSMEQLTTSSASQMEQMNTFLQQFKDIAASRPAPKEESPQPAKFDMPGEDEIEGYSNSQLVGLIGNLMQHVVTDSLGKMEANIDKKISGVSSLATRTTLEQQYTKAAAKFSDFDEWKEDIDKALRDPEQREKFAGLTMEDAYHIIKARNPEKAQKLEDSRKEAEAKKQEEESGKDKKTPFSGLLPTSGVGQTTDTKMNASEAAEKAYEEHLSGVLGADV